MYVEATVASQQLLTVSQTEGREEATKETAAESKTTITAASNEELLKVNKSSTTETTKISTDRLLTNSKDIASVSPNRNSQVSTTRAKDKSSETTTAIETTILTGNTAKSVINQKKNTSSLVAFRAPNVNTVATSSTLPVYSCSSASSSLIPQPPPTKIFKTDHLCVNPAPYGLHSVAAAAAVGRPCVYCVIPVPVVSTHSLFARLFHLVTILVFLPLQRFFTRNMYCLLLIISYQAARV